MLLGLANVAGATSVPVQPASVSQSCFQLRGPTQNLTATADLFPMRSRLINAIVAMALVASLLVGLAQPAAASSDGTPTVQVDGRGWGHGWGMGQYGAYGYARDFGWTSAQILNHFYGGTTAGSVPAGNPVNPAALRIDLRSDRGAPTTVAITNGAIQLSGVPIGPDLGQYVGAVRLRINSSGNGFTLETAADCGGPFVAQPDITAQTNILIEPVSTAGGADGLLRYCRASTAQTVYPGQLEAVNWQGALRTVNIVAIEDYLRGVVPKEVPASWGGPVGGPAVPGHAALEAQAVAARSYVLAGNPNYRGTFADSCDTTACQVYGGWYETATAANPDGIVFDPRTDAAISATAGVVRLRNDNLQVAETFYSSSTGGYTNPIDPFPAVVDEGDAVDANPNSQWTTTVDLSAYENSVGLGEIQEIEVTERNGLSGNGTDGGRVEQVRISFENGSRTLTGNAFRRAFGLKSDWFSVGAVLRDGVSVGSNSKFVDGAAQIFLGRAPTAAERARWIAQVNAGNRGAFVTELAFSDEWAGSLIDGLYRDVLGRPADAAGRAYWLDQLSGPSNLQFLNVWFYGSQEYYNQAGATPTSFATALYTEVLGRQPDSAGLDYWSEQLVHGQAGLDDVAAGFVGSLENRRTRIDSLFTDLLGRQPDLGARDFYADRLLLVDDIELAAELAVTDEFYNRAQSLG